MVKSAKVSIVIPIYNVEEYLPRCLDSVLSQTYPNIEVILVDDGSPDRCGAMCDEYAAKDSRVVVHHIPNGGVAHARQVGVESSSGEYITFVDPDDWMTLDGVEVLLSHMRDDLDIVVCRDIRVYPNRVRCRNYPEMELTTREYVIGIVSYNRMNAPWGKLYRRNLFTKDSFPNFKHTQDWLMNLDIAFRVNKVKFTNDKVYNYFMRLSSTSQSFKDTFEYEMSLVAGLKSIIERNGAY